MFFVLDVGVYCFCRTLIYGPLMVDLGLGLDVLLIGGYVYMWICWLLLITYTRAIIISFQEII